MDDERKSTDDCSGLRDSGNRRDTGPAAELKQAIATNRERIEELRNTILTSNIMLKAYACVLLILAFFLGLLTIVLVILCFFYPEKANAFLLLLGGPLAALVIGHTIRLGKMINEKH